VKNVLFLVDVSGSMQDSAGECSEYMFEGSKLCCVKKFLNGFIDEMKDGSNVSVFVYSTTNFELLFDFTTLNETNREELKDKIIPLEAYGGTPMCRALEEGFKKAEEKMDEGKPEIVLLTDGCENSGCSCEEGSSVIVAGDYTGIPVHTIGFGQGLDKGPCSPPVCIGPLQEVADITGGEFFRAKTCGELIETEIPEPIEVEMEADVWTFGDREFSEDEALKEKIRVSIPVVVRYNQSTFLPGTMSITLVNGELEKLVGFIEETCFTEKELVLTLYLNYPVSLKDENKICMEFKSGDKCQKLACEKTIEFHEIERPGKYKFYSRHEKGVLKILV